MFTGDGRARKQGGINTGDSVDCGTGNCSSSDGRKACSRACKGDTTDLTRDAEHLREEAGTFGNKYAFDVCVSGNR